MNTIKGRIAIAEFCGWTRIQSSGNALYGWHPNEEVGTCSIPQYDTDLNAMHEAERRLSLDKRESYRQMLAQITQVNRMASIGWTTLNATALQRFEAFLKTIGKREDGE